MTLLRQWNATHLCAGLIFLTALIVYANTVNNGFVWDSNSVILEENRIRTLQSALDFFTQPYTRDASSAQKGVLDGAEPIPYYRPLVGIVHAIEYRFFGAEPGGYKFVSLLMNALLAVLIFLITLRLTEAKTLSFFAALLWTVNPSKAEIVYWVYSDSHILVAIFVALSFLLYIRGKAFHSLAVFPLALLSQENAVVFPLVLFLYEYLILKSPAWAGARRSAPFFILTFAYLLLRREVVGDLTLRAPVFPDAVNAPVIAIKRLLKMYFLPDAPVTAYHYRPDDFAALNPETIISYLAAAALAILGIYFWKTSRENLFWLFWFLLWAGPFLVAGGQKDYFIAEKPLYLAGLGISVLFTRFLLTTVKPVKFCSLLVIALVIFHAHASFSRSYYWRDTETYLKAAIQHEPDFSFLHYALAITLNNKNRYSESIDHLSRLHEKEPEEIYFRLGLAEAYYAQGNDQARRKQYTEAIASYWRSLSMHPRQPRIYNNLGNVYYMQGDYDQAAAFYRKALALQPDFSNAIENLKMVSILKLNK